MQFPPFKFSKYEKMRIFHRNYFNCLLCTLCLIFSGYKTMHSRFKFGLDDQDVKMRPIGVNFAAEAQRMMFQLLVLGCNEHDSPGIKT